MPLGTLRGAYPITGTLAFGISGLAAGAGAKPRAVAQVQVQGTARGIYVRRWWHVRAGSCSQRRNAGRRTRALRDECSLCSSSAGKQHACNTPYSLGVIFRLTGWTQHHLNHLKSRRDSCASSKLGPHLASPLAGTRKRHIHFMRNVYHPDSLCQSSLPRF